MTEPRTKTQPVERPDGYATLTLDEMGPLGDTIAQFEGEPINVFGGIVGEEVVARIVRYRRRRKHYVSGIVTEVLEASPHRVAAPCPYFGPCTGCQWQHIDYGRQIEMKREVVEAEISGYGIALLCGSLAHQAWPRAARVPKPRAIQHPGPGDLSGSSTG